MLKPKIKNFLVARNVFNHMTVCFNRKLAVSLGGYPQCRFKEDYALWLMMASNGARMFNSDNIYICSGFIKVMFVEAVLNLLKQSLLFQILKAHGLSHPFT